MFDSLGFDGFHILINTFHAIGKLGLPLILLALGFIEQAKKAVNS